MVEIVDGVRTTGNISSVDLPELNVTDTLGVLSPSDIFTFVDRHMENASVKTLKICFKRVC